MTMLLSLNKRDLLSALPVETTFHGNDRQYKLPTDTGQLCKDNTQQ